MCGPVRRESKAFKDLPPVQWGEVFHADWVRFAGTALLVAATARF